VNGPLLGSVLRKRLTIKGTTLRARPEEYRSSLVKAFSDDVMGAVITGCMEGSDIIAREVTPRTEGSVAPVIARVFDGLDSVSTAFEEMLESANIGKFVIRVAPLSVASPEPPNDGE
jgi:tumor protein p53-inducible protein 3